MKMSDRIILEETVTAFGYLVRKERVKYPSFTVEHIGGDADENLDELIEALENPSPYLDMESAYTLDGCYIGSPKDAKHLCEVMGILPELRDGSIKEDMHPCSIGFCERDGKWYGCSHRAIHGFMVGSVVKSGDCAYRPKDEAAFDLKYFKFFGKNEYRKDATYKSSVNADGDRGVYISATYTDDVPNEKLRGTKYELFWPYMNEKFGRGEWMAETLEDAKQMASDFAEGVS